MQHLSQQLFSEFESEIKKHWPTFAYLPSNIDTLSVYDYQNSLVRANTSPKTLERQGEFRNEVKKYVESLFGEKIANEIDKQMETNHSISTAQHHTPISSINTLTGTLQTNLAYFGKSEVDRKYILVLACAGISLTNSWSPRAYTFQTESEHGVTQLQLPFFGRTMDSYPVIFTPAYTKESLKQMQKRIRHFQSEKLLKKREYKKVEQLLDIIFSDGILKQKNFVDQISLQNYHVWKKLFEKEAENTPDLIFLSQEKIALELLKNYHLKNKTIINSILFNNDYHQLILKYFNNIFCAFSLEKNYGTFLFWGVSKDGQRIQLFPKNGKLVSPDETFALELTPQAIQEAINSNQIIPSVLLTFILFSFYYGFFLSGGMRQPWYLSQAKEAYVHMLHYLEKTEEAEFVSNVSTNDFVMSRPSLTFITGKNNMRVPANGLDIILYQKDSSWQRIVEATKNLSMREYLYRSYPEIYETFCKEDEKRSGLSEITAQDIEKLCGLEEKIPSWGNLEI